MKNGHTSAVIAFVLLTTACSERPVEVNVYRKDIIELVFAPGVLEADDRYSLVAQTDGLLTALDFREGQHVKRHQLLAVIANEQHVIGDQAAKQLHQIALENSLPSAPALLEIETKIAAAIEKVNYEETQVERHLRLLQKQSIAQVEYDNALLSYANSIASLEALHQQHSSQQLAASQQKIAQRNVSRLASAVGRQNLVRAIGSGIVYSRLKAPGDYVQKGDVIASIGNSDRIYARLHIDESDIKNVKVGQAITVKLNTNPDTVYHAKVGQILPNFDQVSRSFIVKAYFDEKPDFQILGTQLEANVVTGTRKNVLVIPSAYLNEGNQVLLKDKDQSVLVKTGLTSGDWVEILAGLAEGQTIILKKP